MRTFGIVNNLAKAQTRSVLHTAIQIVFKQTASHVGLTNTLIPQPAIGWDEAQT